MVGVGVTETRWLMAVLLLKRGRWGHRFVALSSSACLGFFIMKCFSFYKGDDERTGEGRDRVSEYR